eukprot:1856465-Rhodomonas_salina.2
MQANASCAVIFRKAVCPPALSTRGPSHAPVFPVSKPSQARGERKKQEGRKALKEGGKKKETSESGLAQKGFASSASGGVWGEVQAG